MYKRFNTNITFVKSKVKVKGEEGEAEDPMQNKIDQF